MTLLGSRSPGESYNRGPDIVCPKLALTSFLDETTKRFPANQAIIFENKGISYSELRKAARKFADALSRIGVHKGTRVAIMLPNCPQYVIAFYGTLYTGGIVVQVNPLYREREIEHIASDSEVEAIVVLKELVPVVSNIPSFARIKQVFVVDLDRNDAAPVLDPLPSANSATARTIPFESFLDSGDDEALVMAEIDPEQDAAVLQYTGGTTGRSKGAMLTHFNLVSNVHQNIVHKGDETLEAGQSILTIIPLFHVYGMTCAMNLAVFRGATCILMRRFAVEEVLETIRKYQPTFFPGVPTMYVALNSHPRAHEYGIDSIRVCNSGSAPLPVNLIHSFEAKTGARMYEGYGLSEASPTTHSTPRSSGSIRKPGSIGTPLPGTEARIVDLATGAETLPIGEAGELIIRGPQVMKGYWNMPDETAVALRDGWLYTGDIARMDEDGYFYIVDRKKDLIIAGGYNIYPRDVEEVLYQHPAVQEAVVVGAPHEYRGETVQAFIVLKEGKTATADEIISFCRQNLAAFKVPSIVEFRDQLPKTAVGKILRRVLSEEIRKKEA